MLAFVLIFGPILLWLGYRAERSLRSNLRAANRVIRQMPQPYDQESADVWRELFEWREQARP